MIRYRPEVIARRIEEVFDLLAGTRACPPPEDLGVALLGDLQHDCCFMCAVEGEPYVGDLRLYKDHNHSTGMIRSLLCPMHSTQEGKIGDVTHWSAYRRFAPANGWFIRYDGPSAWDVGGVFDRPDQCKTRFVDQPLHENAACFNERRLRIESYKAAVNFPVLKGWTSAQRKRFAEYDVERAAKFNEWAASYDAHATAPVVTRSPRRRQTSRRVEERTTSIRVTLPPASVPLKSILPEEGCVRIDAILKALRITKDEWWRGVEEGQFPQPAQLSPRIQVWMADDIRELIANIGAREAA